MVAVLFTLISDAGDSADMERAAARSDESAC